MLFKQHNKFSPLNSAHYAMLYPQNGDHIVAIDSVTSLHTMYSHDGVHPLRSLVTSVLSHFGPFFEDRTDRGPK